MPLFEQYHAIIPDFSRFQQSLHNPLPVHLRVNRLLITPQRLKEYLAKKDVHVKQVLSPHDTLYVAPGLESPGNLLEYYLGYIHPQALTSALAAIALSPEPGAYLLDMCAAPGGKSAHCAELMNNTGLVVANDLYAMRHMALGHTLSRLGVLNAVMTAYQAQQFPLRQRFDYVLADVPCSGEGRFRKTRADAQFREHKGGVKLTDLQRRIILRGFDLLKPGGEMLYSTCTYNPDENESVVHYLLQKRPATLCPIQVTADVEPGILKWRDQRYDQRLSRAERFYPHRIDSVGFFMARIIKE
ncbi:MAG: RsmB/NOP family class I SAM-dependent RNA methyltransferase [Desulfatiglandaceae bacterium]